MVGLSTAAELEDADVTVGLVDGRVAMSTQIGTAVRLETPDLRPLSTREPHATLRVADQDVRVVIDLDGDAAAELARALTASLEGENDA